MRWATILAVVVFSAGAGIGLLKLKTFREHGSQPAFYQSLFAPAVMLACHRGWTTIEPQDQPENLRAFLKLERDDFDCRDLPADLATRAGEGARLSMAGGMSGVYYLFRSTAAWWRAFGLRWTALDSLVALLVGIATVSCYAMFRLVSPAPVAALASVVLAASPKSAIEMLSLRTYSKAAFMLAALAVLAHLVARRRSPRSTAALAAVCGAIIGIGAGFRSDSLILLPLAVLTTTFFLPAMSVHSGIRRVAPIAALLAGFVVVYWPTNPLGDADDCQFHEALLGLTLPRVAQLGMVPSIYNFGSIPTDTFVANKVTEYAEHTLGFASPGLCSPAYNRASAELTFDLIRTFPADALSRVYGSALTVLSRSFEFTSPGQTGEFAFLNRLTAWIAPLGPVLAAMGVAAIWARSSRMGIAAAVFIVYLTMYPAISFEDRHWFHLRFIPWWTALALVSAAMGPLRTREGRRAFGFGAFAVIAGVVGLATVLLGLRTVQLRSAKALMQRYAEAPVEAIPFTAVDTSSAQAADPVAEVTVLPAALGERDHLLALTLEGASCLGEGPVPIDVLYISDGPSHDLSTRIAAARPSGSGVTRVFVPVYQDVEGDPPHFRFAGISLHGVVASCVTGLNMVPDEDAPSPRMEVVLGADWTNGPLYRSLQYPLGRRPAIDQRAVSAVAAR